MKRAICLLLAGLVLGFVPFFAAETGACVGKTIYLGRLPGVEQEILSELFIWLVNERTGTSIEIKAFEDSRTSHSALEKAAIDLYMEDTAIALKDILGHRSSTSVDTGALVRREYQKRFNLIWLEPWGLTGTSSVEGEGLSYVAPVVRRDTLKKFPALSRLINKMAGVVDDRTMKRLVAESAVSPVRDVTKRFLKANKLI